MNELNISDNIARLRRDKKITQEQLADFIGVTKASVSKWENAQSIPDIAILPRLAAFFDVTVDELIGYTPLLSKEQIQRLYRKFGKDFSERPFEEVMTMTREYAKRYYSCYPFLLQVCILWLNHCMMAGEQERQSEILSDTAKLCGRIIENSRDIRIQSNAVVLRALIYMQTGRVQEVIDDLQDISISGRFGSQSSVLLAQAYAMKGDMEKAEGLLQISMYESISNLLSGAVGYLSVKTDDSQRCRQTIDRIERVSDIYRLAELNPNNLAAFEYQAAVCYMAYGEKEKALEHIEKYVVCLEKLFSSDCLRLHGDGYFNKIEKWLDEELDNGTNAPRDRKLVLENSKKTLAAPLFSTLNGEPAFERMKNRLEELR